MADGGPLAGLTSAERLARVQVVLELTALGYGVPHLVVGAAREILQHARWEREMREGRPKQRMEGAGGTTVVVVDNVGQVSAAILALDRKARGTTIEASSEELEPDQDDEGETEPRG